VDILYRRGKMAAKNRERSNPFSGRWSPTKHVNVEEKSPEERLVPPVKENSHRLGGGLEQKEKNFKGKRPTKLKKRPWEMSE